MRPTGMRELARLDCGWAIYCDVGHQRARPYFVRRGMVRTPFEVARLPEGRLLFRQLHDLWKLDRRDLRGPWREDAKFRAIDYAHDAVRLELQLQRRWDDSLVGKAA